MKKAPVLIVLIMALSIMAGVVSAQGGSGQDGRGNGQRGDLIDIIQEQTSLTPQELREALQADGATLASVIMANGGDVQAVIDAMVAMAQERVDTAIENERITAEEGAERIAEFTENVTEALNSDNPLRNAARNRGDNLRGRVEDMVGRTLLGIVSESTNLEPQEIVAQIRDGATVAEIITANGGDVEAISAQVISNVTETLTEAVANENITQEQADVVLATLDENLTAALNGEAPLPRIRDGRNGRNNDLRRVANTIAEAAGITPEEVAEQVQAGSTLAQILSSNGVDVDSFIAEQIAPFVEQQNTAVAEGRISQALADARINLRQVELSELLNRQMVDADADA